jgi:hypothetical protein
MARRGGEGGGAGPMNTIIEQCMWKVLRCSDVDAPVNYCVKVGLLDSSSSSQLSSSDLPLQVASRQRFPLSARHRTGTKPTTQHSRTGARCGLPTSRSEESSYRKTKSKLLTDSQNGFNFVKSSSSSHWRSITSGLSHNLGVLDTNIDARPSVAV